MAVPLGNLKQVFNFFIYSESCSSNSRARASELLKAFLAWDETEKWENAVEKWKEPTIVPHVGLMYGTE